MTYKFEINSDFFVTATLTLENMLEDHVFNILKTYNAVLIDLFHSSDTIKASKSANSILRLLLTVLIL